MKKTIMVAALFLAAGYAGQYMLKDKYLPADTVDTNVPVKANQQESEPSSSEEGSVIHAQFNLINQEGVAVTEKDFRGKRLLVYFGFTHCPDICPTDVAVISDAFDALGEKADNIIPVFITVEPERDTPEVMKAFLAHFNKAFIGLTGSKEQVEQAKTSFAVFSSEQKDKEGEVNINHSAYMYYMDENGQFITHFSHGINADALAKELQVQ